jgi:hypothetical protein
MDAELNQALYDLKNSEIAFSSKNKLLKKFHSRFGADNVKKWSDKQELLQLFKPARKRFKRNFIYCNGVFEWLHADLAQMTNISEHNDGAQFVLCVVDCMSRKGFCAILTSKKSEEVAKKT